MKKANVRNILEISRKSKWSLEDFNWDHPLSDDLDDKTKKDLGTAFLYISGIERLGAAAFRIHARNVDNKDAAKLFEIFAEDEERHADAELAMAKRLGLQWKDLPWSARRMFKLLQKDIESLPDKEIGRWLHNVNCSSIMFFEFGLDAIVLPILKEMTNDELQNQVWEKIDKDESRHLAMDYWLIENRYARDMKNKKKPVEEPFLSNLKLSYQKALLPAFLAARMVYVVPGFLPFTQLAFKLPIKKEYIQDYIQRVDEVPKVAPHAMEVKSYRVRAKLIKKMLSGFVENPVM